MKQEIKTFGSGSCKHRDLPKHDTWPFISDNRKKKTGKVLVSCKHRPKAIYWKDPKTLCVFVTHKHKFVFVFVKELIFVPKTPVIGRHKMMFVTEV